MEEDKDLYEIPINDLYLQRAYQGSVTDYKNGLRGLKSGEPDTLAAREIRFLQRRNQDIIRNNGYGRIALNVFKTKLGCSKVIWKDKKGKEHNQMQDLWDEFARKPTIDGRGNYATFQGESNGALYTDGASFVRFLVVRSSNKAKVPLKLQPIMASQQALEAIPVQPLVNTAYRHGIEFDYNGIPLNYLFYRNNLEAQIQMKKGFTPYNFVTIPASEIIHTFEREFVGQWIGIPKLTAVLLDLYALDDLIASTVSKQQAAQAISIIVEKTGSILNQTPLNTAIATSIGTANIDGQKKTIFNTKASSVQYAGTGESVKWFQGGDIGGNLQVLVEMEIRKIAAISDIMYHELTQDTGKMNYSALLGLLIQSRNRIEYLYNYLLIPCREQVIADKFKDFAILYSKKVSNAVPYFQLPRWRGVDELKDAQADLLELQNGMTTITSVLAERGLTPDDILADKENRDLFAKELNIEYTNAVANPSMNTLKNVQANSATTSK
jgi:lambda family phage portal protein